MIARKLCSRRAVIWWSDKRNHLFNCTLLQKPLYSLLSVHVCVHVSLPFVFLLSVCLSLCVCESLSHTLRSLPSLPGSFFHRFCAPNWLPRAVHLTVELGEQEEGPMCEESKQARGARRQGEELGSAAMAAGGGSSRNKATVSTAHCVCVSMRRFSFLSPFCQLWTKQKKLQWQKSGLMDGWKHYSDKVQRSHENLTLTKVQRSHGKMKNLLWQSPAFSWKLYSDKSPAVPWMDENIILTNEWSQHRMKFLLWFVDGWMDGWMCVVATVS
jgi:hypothetical protein